LIRPLADGMGGSLAANDPVPVLDLALVTAPGDMAGHPFDLQVQVTRRLLGVGGKEEYSKP